MDRDHVIQLFKAHEPENYAAAYGCLKALIMLELAYPSGLAGRVECFLGVMSQWEDDSCPNPPL